MSKNKLNLTREQWICRNYINVGSIDTGEISIPEMLEVLRLKRQAAVKKSRRHDPWDLVGGVPRWVAEQRPINLVFKVNSRLGKQGIAEMRVSFPVPGESVVRVEWGFCSPRDQYTRGYRKVAGYPNLLDLPLDLAKVPGYDFRHLLRIVIINGKLPSWWTRDIGMDYLHNHDELGQMRWASKSYGELQ